MMNMRRPVVLVVLLLCWIVCMSACSQKAPSSEHAAEKSHGSPAPVTPSDSKSEVAPSPDPAFEAEEAAVDDMAIEAPAPTAPTAAAPARSDKSAAFGAAPGAKGSVSGLGASGAGKGGGGLGGSGGIGFAGRGGEGKGEAVEAKVTERAKPSSAKKDSKPMPSSRAKKRRRRPVPKPYKPAGPVAQPQARKLTAGEWRDVDHFDFWSKLFQSSQEHPQGRWSGFAQQWKFNTSLRFPVTVRAQGQSVVDARVVLYDAQQSVVWEARTDNQGRAELFAAPFGIKAQGVQGPFSVLVESGQNTKTVAVQPSPNARISIDLNASKPVTNGLDIMFMVDTTGSMGDELSYLQAELKNVIQRVQQQNGQDLDIRVSVNFFRDKGDDYVVRSFPFNRDMTTVQSEIGAQSAGGGGDFPEAVSQAMDDAISGAKHDWRPNARARLLFLVLDAPGHENTNDIALLQSATKLAAKKGVRIVPLAGSGINKSTESLMRFMSIVTGGSYLFLTSHSGIGGSHVKPTIGPHKVELLNDLMVRVIGDFTRKSWAEK